LVSQFLLKLPTQVILALQRVLLEEELEQLKKPIIQFNHQTNGGLKAPPFFNPSSCKREW
jgi:hypothetical protein